MKKLLAFILAVSTALSLAACGGSTEEVSSESDGYTNTIQIAVDEALTALKNYDSENLSKYFEGNALSEQTLKAPSRYTTYLLFRKKKLLCVCR